MFRGKYIRDYNLNSKYLRKKYDAKIDVKNDENVDVKIDAKIDAKVRFWAI